MFREPPSSRNVVDADHVVAAARRARHDIVVDQHNRNLRVFQDRENLLVHARRIAHVLDRMENHPGHPLPDEVLRQLLGHFRARAGIVHGEVAQEDAAPLPLAHAGHLAADGREDLAVGKPRQDQANGPRGGPGERRQERPLAFPPHHEPRLAQALKRLDNGEPRHPETAHELRFAEELPRFVLAAADLAPERLENHLVLRVFHRLSPQCPVKMIP